MPWCAHGETNNCGVVNITPLNNCLDRRRKEFHSKEKMFTHSKAVILSLCVIFTVSISLLQKQTFERVSIKYGNLIKSIQARSIRTCVDSCLQHCECRYVRFTKSSKGCQLYADVLLYYVSGETLPSSDVVDFKKVLLWVFYS